MPSIHTILHPTDLSENSEAAFGLACSLAEQFHARLLLFHVLHPAVAPGPSQAAKAHDALSGRLA